ncbi:uncharacterized protein L199_000848 [Kwoniella botswanensis]|uniref:uncharacterized protein n=1 Tax=Kwoniella botswanensis TaxID=1268659 RepID=UPI00315D1A7C
MSSGPIRAGTITGTSESGSAGTITVKDMGDIDPGQKVTLLVSMYLTRCANLSRMTMSGDLWKPDSTGTVQATVPLQDVSFNWGCRLAWDPSKEVSESSLKSAQAFLESKLLPPNMPSGLPR